MRRQYGRPGNRGPVGARAREDAGGEQLGRPARAWPRSRGRRGARRALVAKRAGPPRRCRAPRARERDPPASSGSNGSPSQAQRTVRSFGTLENVTPWSTAKRWPPVDRQEVAGLPIGVVDDRVEQRDAAQAGIVPVDHVDDVGRRIDLDPGLEHALAGRAVAQERRRHDAPAERLRDEERGDLAPRQRADREVEQRPLAGGRLPDREEVIRFAPGPDDHRVVRRAGKPADRLELGGSKGLEGRPSAIAMPGGGLSGRSGRSCGGRCGRSHRAGCRTGARWPPGADDPEGALDERPGGVGGEPDAQQVRAVLVVVLDLDDRLGLRLDSSSSSPGARASMRIFSASPSQPRVRVVARKASLIGSSSGFSSGSIGVGGILHDAPPVELHEQPPEALREHRDLGLLEGDAHDAPAIASLQEEGAAAGLADGAGGEAIGNVEDEESCAAWSDCTGIRQRAGQVTVTEIVWWPRAPSGAGGDSASVWTSPAPSVARTSIECRPGVASQRYSHWTHVAFEIGAESCAPPASRRRRSGPRRPGCRDPAPTRRPRSAPCRRRRERPERGTSIRDWVRIGAFAAQPRGTQNPSKVSNRVSSSSASHFVAET